MEQKTLLISRCEDLVVKGTKTGCAASRFLTPAEAQSVTNFFTRRRDVTLTLDGGYDGAERVRAVFLNADWGEYQHKEIFTVLKIEVPLQENQQLGHRDVLGAIMNLGIERTAIGDIIPNPLALICLPELAVYISENLTKIGRVNVKLSCMELSEIPPRTENFDIKTDTVASVRLDAVVSTAFSLPRSKAVELIEAGRVSLNHEVKLQPSKEVAEGSLLSVRGMGRAKLLEIGGTSKKGRTFIKTGLYK